MCLFFGHNFVLCAQLHKQTSSSSTAARPTEPDLGKDPKMILGSQGHAGGCQLSWHDISRSVVHPQCWRAAFNKSSNGRNAATLAEPLLSRLYFTGKFRYLGRPWRNSVSVFFLFFHCLLYCILIH